jgi:hypothetical protein
MEKDSLLKVTGTLISDLPSGAANGTEIPAILDFVSALTPMAASLAMTQALKSDSTAKISLVPVSSSNMIFAGL